MLGYRAGEKKTSVLPGAKADQHFEAWRESDFLQSGERIDPRRGDGGSQSRVKKRVPELTYEVQEGGKGGGGTSSKPLVKRGKKVGRGKRRSPIYVYIN